jgi:ParB family chromosome partitioning protein
MVTKKPKGLGLGLEALLGPKVADVAPADASRPTTLKLTQLQAGKYQPRTRMDEGSLYELAESIKSQGIMQPILVRPVGASGYEIIAGERRFRAARLAGLDEVPVLVKDVPDEAAAVKLIAEVLCKEPEQIWKSDVYRVTIANERDLLLLSVEMIAQSAPPCGKRG